MSSHNEIVKKIIIIPAGGMGPGICEVIKDINGSVRSCARYEIIGFLDDLIRIETRSDFRKSVDSYETRSDFHESVGSYTVLGTISEFSRYSDCQFIISGFANDKDIERVRRTCKMMALPDGRFETVIHPSASVSKHAEVGNGCVISPGVRIAPGVKIGNHVMVMPNAVIEHNTVIGDFCNICAGAIISGYVNIGEVCWIGANASITSRINIGDDSLVGIGAVVIRDVERESVVVGNPAKFLKEVVATHV